jgi:AcrR family transcriptional regulator
LAHTRDRILDAAANLMRNRGLAGATTKEIARGAGLSEAALYRHFDDQFEIFLHVMKERMPPFIVAMGDLPNRVGRADVVRTLQEIAMAALTFYGEIGPMAGSLFSQPALLARHQDALRREKAGPQVALVRLGAYLKAEQRLGRFPKKVDAEVCAALLLGACFQRAFIRNFWGAARSEEDDLRFVKKAVRLLLPSGAGRARSSRASPAGRRLKRAKSRLG